MFKLNQYYLPWTWYFRYLQLAKGQRHWQFQCFRNFWILTGDWWMNQLYVKLCFLVSYCNVPKFSDRQAWANSVNPDQTAPRSSLIRVYNVCHSICIFWTHYSMVKPPKCSNCRTITPFCQLGVRILGILRYLDSVLSEAMFEGYSQLSHDYIKMLKHKYLKNLMLLNWLWPGYDQTDRMSSFKDIVSVAKFSNQPSYSFPKSVNGLTLDNTWS